MLILLLLALVSSAAAEQCTSGRSQYTNEPVSYTDASNKFSTPILYDTELLDSITRLNRERTSERPVHAKGSGAFGYFVASRNFTNVINADFLNKAGKKTPIAVRFSTSTGERGTSDVVRDARGFSVRFYTMEGNFDLLGFRQEMYFYKDPNHFAALLHAFRRSPESNLNDESRVWDAITLIPESLNIFLRFFAEDGIIGSFRHMPGHGIHSFQVENNRGKYSFVRFAFTPVDGIKTISYEESGKIGAADPNYAARDLYEAIERGDYPRYTVGVQIIPMADCLKMGSRCIDVTRLIPKDKYPPIPIGTMVLNKNADHFENEIEQIALCPGNLVKGILGAPDTLFESRVLMYRQTHFHRLGKNHNKIPVNCPLSAISTYNRDGMPLVGDNEGDAPNYYPNSFGGPQPYDAERYRNRTCSQQSKLVKIKETQGWDNIDQLTDFWNSLTENGKEILIKNLKGDISGTKEFIQIRACDRFATIHPDFGLRMANALNIK